MMMRPAFVRSTPLIFGALICLGGCAGGGPQQPETAPVHGRVTYKDKPVTDASVIFIRAGAPRFASGRTDQDGRFQLTTFTPGDGAIVGENVVTIVKRVQPVGAGTTAVDPAGGNLEAMDAAFDRQARQAPTASAIPTKYATQRTTDLNREVKPGENEFEIELAD